MGPIHFERMHELFAELKKTYGYILVDTGPILAHSEAGAIANQADGVIVVTEWMKTSKQDMSGMLALLKTYAVPVLGVVLNRVDIEKYKEGAVGSDFLLPNIGQAA
jgi:succinoglycan biosynthesis transport protein ExoP